MTIIESFSGYFYDFYLFTQLYDVYWPDKQEYDLKFAKLVLLYEDYNASPFNDVNDSGYNCMERYIKSLNFEDRLP